MASLVKKSWCFTWHSSNWPQKYLSNIVSRHDEKGIYQELITGFPLELFDGLVDWSGCLDSKGVSKVIVYGCASVEVGEQERKFHVQGFVRFRQAVTDKQMRAWLPDCWPTPAKGHCEFNRDYIFHTGKHEDKPGLIYKLPEAGLYENCREAEQEHKENQFAAIAERLKDGDSLLDMLVDYPSVVCRYYTQLSRLEDALKRKVKEDRIKDRLRKVTPSAGDEAAWASIKNEFANRVDDGVLGGEEWRI